MEIQLTPDEVRVIGAMIEKEITTPEYYPMTLNALTHACNQKSNRDPVVNFDDSKTAKTLDDLREKRLVALVTAANARAPKFKQLFRETVGLDDGEVAVLCELMLRGPQTVGELRNRADRMFKFTDMAQVEGILEGLMKRENIRLVAKLPRQPGRKESRYTHLLSGEPAAAAEIVADSSPTEAGPGKDVIERLRADVEDLRKELAILKQRFDDFEAHFP